MSKASDYIESHDMELFKQTYLDTALTISEAAQRLGLTVSQLYDILAITEMPSRKGQIKKTLVRPNPRKARKGGKHGNKGTTPLCE